MGASQGRSLQGAHSTAAPPVPGYLASLPTPTLDSSLACSHASRAHQQCSPHRATSCPQVSRAPSSPTLCGTPCRFTGSCAS